MAHLPMNHAYKEKDNGGEQEKLMSCVHFAMLSHKGRKVLMERTCLNKFSNYQKRMSERYDPMPLMLKVSWKSKDFNAFSLL